MSKTKAAGHWKRALILGLLPLSALYLVFFVKPVETQNADLENDSAVTTAVLPAHATPVTQTERHDPTLAPPAQKAATQAHELNSQSETSSEPAMLDRDFAQLLEFAQNDGGEALKAAFDIHDLCSGVPRSLDDRDSWYLAHASDINVDVDAFEQLIEQCADVPVLPFDRRLSLILPHAENGDLTAQFLAGASYPMGSVSRINWLSKASDGGHVESMLALAESILAVSATGKMKISAWKLLHHATEQGQDEAPFALANLVTSMTSEEVKLATDQYAESGIAAVTAAIEKEMFYAP